MASTKNLFGRNYKGKVAMDGGIFWLQLIGWLWIGLFSSRN